MGKVHVLSAKQNQKLTQTKDNTVHGDRHRQREDPWVGGVQIILRDAGQVFQLTIIPAQFHPREALHQNNTQQHRYHSSTANRAWKLVMFSHFFTLSQQNDFC